LATALASALALGGCGGVEFQGGVFDAMGLSGSGGPAPDVRMAERPPLLVPPDVKTLPTPGGGVAAVTAREDWPRNPEIVQSEIAEAKRDAEAAETATTDRINPLKGKNNPLIEKWLSKKRKAPPLDDTPEPDPADKPPVDEAVAGVKPKPLQPHVPQEITPAPDEAFRPATPDSYNNPSALY
jgi:hypothetical protein